MPPPVDEIDEPASTPLQPGQMHCPQCKGAVNSHALTCRWCGLRLHEDTHTPVFWLAILGTITLAVMFIGLGVLALVGNNSNTDFFSSLAGSDQPKVLVAQGYDSSLPTQQHIRQFVSQTNFWPNTNLDAGLPEPQLMANQVLSGIEVSDNATIVLSFHENLEVIGGHSITLTAMADTQGLPVWHCSDSTLDSTLLPATCFNETNTLELIPPSHSPSVPAAPTHSSLSGEQLPSANFVIRILNYEFQNTRSIRNTVWQYKQENGYWPSHEQAGLADPRRLGSQAMAMVQADNQGRVIYTLSGAIKELEGQTITLVADTSRELWFCESNIPRTHLPTRCVTGFE
jgi:hypothetical protein